MKIRTLIIISILLFSIASHASERDSLLFPRIGMMMPDYTFTDIYQKPGAKIKISELKGKWTIIDIWALGCASCIASFPKMNTIQSKFKDDINFILLGHGPDYRYYEKTKQAYDGYRKKLDLKFNSVFDSVFFARSGFLGFPQILVIDPNGILKYHTGSITEQDIKDILSNKTPNLRRSYSARNKNGDRIFETEMSTNYNPVLPILTTGNQSNGGISDTSFTFRSLLRELKPGESVFYLGGGDLVDNKHLQRKTRFEIFAPIYNLYKQAYTGFTSGYSNVEGVNPVAVSEHRKIYPNLILEIADSALFKSSDIKTNQGYYCYSLVVPPKKATGDQVKEIMQRDLKNYFGFDAAVEQRLVTVYSLKVKDEDKVEKLRTKGANPEVYTSMVSFGLKKKLLQQSDKRNVPERFGVSYQNADFRILNYFLENAINIYHKKQGNPLYEAVLFDNTGIDYNIDITLKGDQYDLQDVIRGLNELGLDLVKTEKEMKAVVVRDPKPNRGSLE